MLRHRSGAAAAASAATAALAAAVAAAAIAGLQGFAAANKQPCSSKRKLITSLSFYETLPGSRDSMLQGFVILTQALGKCVAHSSCDKGFDLDTDVQYDDCIKKLQHSEHPSRQQQQLLQAVVWPLPLLLLQTAARFGPQEALITRVAAEAAWLCCTCWQAPALPAAAQQQPAAAAAAVVAGSDGSTYTALEPQQAPAEQLLLPMLQVWMQLIQQQLLQPPVGLLCVATAARQQQQQQQQQQGCSTSFQQTKQLLEGPMCSCCPPNSSLKKQHSTRVYHASSNSISSSSSSSMPPTCALECDRLYGLGVLLLLLQPLSYLYNTPRSAAVWSSKLPAVLLVFEVIMRQLLPLAVPCSSSSSSSSSGGNSGGEPGIKSSSAVVQLYEMLKGSLFELVYREGKQAPLDVALLGPEAAVSASDTHSNEEPQQQQQQQQQPQEEQQQSAQLLQVQRQFFSVIASHLKLCRCPGSPAKPFGYLFGQVLELADKVARAQAKSVLRCRSRDDHTVASLSEAQAALAPWLG